MKSRVWGPLLLVSLLLAACGGQAAPAAVRSAAPSAPSSRVAAAAPAPVPVSFRLPWLVAGDDAPYALGIVSGDYARQGLQVTMGQGKGSAVVGEAVANGDDTFGLIDAGTAVSLISKGAPLEMVGVYIQKSIFCFMYRPAYTRLTSLADLRGKTIIDSAGTPELTFLPALLAQGGLTMKDVKVVDASPSALPGILAVHPHAIRLGYVTDYLAARKITPDAKFKLYSDFGFSLYNLGVVTSRTELREHPGQVRAFLAGTATAWTDTLKHPSTAVRDLVHLFPSANASLMGQQLAATLDLLHTPATVGHVPGWMAPADWSHTLKLMHEYGGVAQLKPAADYYTDAYLPAS